MVPSVKDVIRVRYVLTAVLRLIGIVLTLGAIIPIGSWLFEGVRDSDMFWFGYYMPRIFAGSVFLGTGLLTTFLAPWIVRLVTPLPRLPQKCPRCRHQIVASSATAPICTECGLTLPIELATRSTPPPFPPSP